MGLMLSVVSNQNGIGRNDVETLNLFDAMRYALCAMRF